MALEEFGREIMIMNQERHISLDDYRMAEMGNSEPNLNHSLISYLFTYLA